MTDKPKDPWRFVGRHRSNLGLKERLRRSNDAKGPKLPLEKGAGSRSTKSTR